MRHFHQILKINRVRKYHGWYLDRPLKSPDSESHQPLYRSHCKSFDNKCDTARGQNKKVEVSSINITINFNTCLQDEINNLGGRDWEWNITDNVYRAS
jgi:hypothetical protein